METTYDSFLARHIGLSEADLKEMLSTVGAKSLDEMIERTVPASIRLADPPSLGMFNEPLSEVEALKALRLKADKNQVFRSFIGLGYYNTITPAVIQRNILENPGWYTQYTPYQPEISQGRLEALLNFQTMVADLTALDVANASLLDEGTAAAEAMTLSYAAKKKAGAPTEIFFVSDRCHLQTIAVVQTRAEAVGIKILVGDIERDAPPAGVFGALFQYPETDGSVRDLSATTAKWRDAGALVSVATDLLALVLLKAPGEFGADIAVGSAQRFGVPMGFGGPHAGFIAVREALVRYLPGRLIGVSKDRAGNPALRLSLQTREQHIRREKATSNICTAQALLANIASMYAVYHGPTGLNRIATAVHGRATILADALRASGFKIACESFFDTLRVVVSPQQKSDIFSRAREKRINLRTLNETAICVALDEATTDEDLIDLVQVFGGSQDRLAELRRDPNRSSIGVALKRNSKFLTDPVFNLYRSETEFLRYLKRLESKDSSLATAMIPLGSCTMKLNATSEMLPITWAEFAAIHPFAPESQTGGYRSMFSDLEAMLASITGFAAVSLQPNAGSQGEFAGLLAIRRFHEKSGANHRKVCLIPDSAHGTNPASAVMAGLTVVAVECDSKGNVDLKDLRSKLTEYGDNLAALMITYPSTHGVFEESIKDICDAVHQVGGKVYLDGANLNALVGLAQPANFGADVCHINLHKTFCIPHGGGGPGVGPIAVSSELAPFLPNHPVVVLGHQGGVGPVSAAPWGSAGILPIPWMYIAMMGSAGLKRATAVAILSANYIAKRLDREYPVLYRGRDGFVAHECIVDLRQFKKSAGVEVEDVAKRLIDYGFHAPTVSFPVVGTMMIEPTESESKAELDRFCDAMLAIREEIREIEEGKVSKENNLLKNAPHTALRLATEEWTSPYSREQAAYPSPATKQYKFWPAVERIDAVYGDRNLVCSCSGWG